MKLNFEKECGWKIRSVPLTNNEVEFLVKIFKDYTKAPSKNKSVSKFCFDFIYKVDHSKDLSELVFSVKEEETGYQNPR